MKIFDRILVVVLFGITVLFLILNLCVLPEQEGEDRPWQVEIHRLARRIEKGGAENIDLSECRYVYHVEPYGSEQFYEPPGEYAVRKINGELYRFDYSGIENDRTGKKTAVNLIMGGMALFLLSVMLFVRQKILRPFWQLSEMPYELAKGNLSVPLKENAGRFFDRFVWGMDLLRERLEADRQRELELQKEKKVLLLSLSHDLKTPLSAVKLYAKALVKGLYEEREKQIQIAEQINAKADEMESYISQIIHASKEEFLDFEVAGGEFYLSDLIGEIQEYYTEKMELAKTDFRIEPYKDCMLKGDLDRSVEAVQNLMENAIKYGDGRETAICFSQEEDCLLLSVENSGCSLPEEELPHIFESFWRGSNVQNAQGNGLGLYICRELMGKMGGEIFAAIRDGRMRVTLVFSKA